MKLINLSLLPTQISKQTIIIYILLKNNEQIMATLGKIYKKISLRTMKNRYKS